MIPLKSSWRKRSWTLIFLPMKPSNSPPGGQGSQQVRRVNFLLPGDNFPDFGVKPPLLAAPTSPKNRRTSPKMYRDLVLGSHFMISLPIKTWQFLYNHMWIIWLEGTSHFCPLLHWISIQNMSEIIQSPSVSSPGLKLQNPSSRKISASPSKKH